MDRIAKGLEADGILTGAGKTKWWTSTINKAAITVGTSDVTKAYDGVLSANGTPVVLSGTLFTGYTRLYIPVVVSAPGHKSGEIVHVRLGSYDGERVRAEMV